METIQLDLTNTNTLYKAFMPFITGGGLFMPKQGHNLQLGHSVTLELILQKETTQVISIPAKVVWIAPDDPHSEFTSGVGVQLLGEQAEHIRSQIESLIADKLKSNQKTDTL